MPSSKYLIPLILLLTAASPSLSQNKIVEVVQSAYQKSRTWQAHFKQKTYVELTGQHIEKTGRLWFQKPGQMRIEYEGPLAKTYISNGKKLWVLDENKKNMQSFEKLAIMVDKQALVFLQGFGNLSEEFFIEKLDFTKIQELKLDTKKFVFLNLKPKKISSVKKLILGINPKTFLVENLILFHVSGNYTIYQFVDIGLNENLNPSLFKASS